MTTTTLEQPMLSYHGDPLIKAKYIARFAAHRAADEVIQGRGFMQGRGCFVGCTLDAYDHSRFPTELGWPEWLAYLADAIFEGLPTTEAAQFGTDLLEAMPVGVNLKTVKNKFLLALQLRNLARITRAKITGAKVCIAAIKSVIELLAKDVEPQSTAWAVAGSAAKSAAAKSAAAWSAAAWSAAESAAQSAAQSAARSASQAARSAARSAGYAGATGFSDFAPTQEYQMQRDDLLALLKDCK